MRAVLSAVFVLALASTANAGAFDVAFVGSGFDASEQQKLTEKATACWNYLLTQEPFKSRTGVLRWWVQAGTFDLKPRYSGRLLTVQDFNPARLALMNSGRHYDKIVVLVDSGAYGGSGGTLAVSYTGSYMPRVAIHELAHSAFGLLDNYVLSNTNPIFTNTTRMDCFSGVPPNPEWAFVPLSDYFKGCRYANWQRASANNLMKDLGAQYFNEVQRRLIDAKLTWYTEQTL